VHSLGAFREGSRRFSGLKVRISDFKQLDATLGMPPAPLECMQPQIFVLGATGTVGREVVELLVGRGISFRAGVHQKPLHLSESEFTEASIETLPIDQSSVESLAQAFEGTDVLFFVSPPDEDFVAMAENVVKAAKQVGVRHIVRLSIAGADHEKFLLAKEHHKVDQMISRSEIPFTLLQPVPFMQNYLGHTRSLKQENQFYEPLGAAHCSFIDARDIAALAVTAMTQNGHAGKTYVMTGPESLSGNDVADVFSRVLERRIRFVDVSDKEARDYWKDSGLSDKRVDWWSDSYRFWRDGEAAFLSPVDPILIGREPITLEMFVKDNIRAFTGAISEAKAA
jgi:uncharacterized protein YbjT (DUF2867 family)